MQRVNRFGYLFIVPFFILFCVFTAYPILNTLYTSFTDDSAEIMDPSQISFVGFENYTQVLGAGTENFNLFDLQTYPLFWKAFLHTWAMWLPNILLQIGLALVLAAWFTNYELNMKGRGFFRAIYFFPNLITITTIAILIYILFDWQHGFVNQLLFGSPQKDGNYLNWFGTNFRIWSIIAGVQTWMWFGYTMITIMAGIESMPRSYFEAALVDGASGPRIFFSIVLPYIKPIMTFVVITSLIGGMQLFDLPWVMFPGGQGGADQAGITMSVYMYGRAFAWDQSLGAGSAAAFIMFAIIGIFSIIYLKMINTNSGKEGVN